MFKRRSDLMVKTIIIIAIIAVIGWFAFRQLIRFLKGDETACSCSSCPSDKKSACHSMKKK
jgi:hypothetical protein